MSPMNVRVSVAQFYNWDNTPYSGNDVQIRQCVSRSW